MKSEYMYCIKMPGVGLLHKTFGTTEDAAIQAFCNFEPRLSWSDAIHAGYKLTKVVITELR